MLVEIKMHKDDRRAVRFTNKMKWKKKQKQNPDIKIESVCFYIHTKKEREREMNGWK